MDIVGGVGISMDQYVALALFQAQVFALDPREWLECRARRSPALRTMAIECVAKRIRDLIAHRAAKALAA
jgi:hypothetical protein